mmetsp:Transcript_19064/g.53659  ORF Transcript_19064/g.53659 Transcript_19064/m.53659 type:complete len:369 (-) Transcript_19064:60-1166(-)
MSRTGTPSTTSTARSPCAARRGCPRSVARAAALGRSSPGARSGGWATCARASTIRCRRRWAAATAPTSAACASPTACGPPAPPPAWTPGAGAWPTASTRSWCRRPSQRRPCACSARPRSRRAELQRPSVSRRRSAATPRRLAATAWGTPGTPAALAPAARAASSASTARTRRRWWCRAACGRRSPAPRPRRRARRRRSPQNLLELLQTWRRPTRRLPVAQAMPLRRLRARRRKKRAVSRQASLAPLSQICSRWRRSAPLGKGAAIARTTRPAMRRISPTRSCGAVCQASATDSGVPCVVALTGSSAAPCAQVVCVCSSSSTDAVCAHSRMGRWGHAACAPPLHTPCNATPWAIVQPWWRFPRCLADLL